MPTLSEVFCPDWVVEVSEVERRVLLQWWEEIVTTPGGVDIAGTRPPGFATMGDIEAWRAIGDRAELAGRTAPDLRYEQYLMNQSVIGIGADYLLKAGTDCSCCHAWRVLALMLLVGVLPALVTWGLLALGIADAASPAAVAKTLAVIGGTAFVGALAAALYFGRVKLGEDES